MDKRYEVYCLVSAVFYDSPTTVREQPLEFAVTRRPAPTGWFRTELEDWVVHLPADRSLQAQGWKVHVSACAADAEEVLAAVWDYCVWKRVGFKFLRDRNALLLANAKYADRGSSGKTVTIYPVDESELEAVLTDLDAVLAGRSGPYILSDLRWGDGPLYVRYGGFVERLCTGEAGEFVPAIEDGDGVLVPDVREPRFHVPPWVTLPAFLRPHLEARNGVTVDGLPYRIEQAIHFSNGGGLYAAESLSSGERVVLKEARPHAGLDLDGSDARTRLRRERDMLERLGGLDVVPAVRDYFGLGDHEFLALEYLDTVALRDRIVERYPLVRLDFDRTAAEEYTRWAMAMSAAVESAVAAVHERGVVLGDLHPFNVLLRADDSVVLIDLEGAGPVEEGRRQSLADPGFMAPRDHSGFAIDRYALACLRLFLFLPLTTLLAIDRSKAAHLAEVIEELFDVPARFLDEAVRTITAGVLPGAVQPRVDPGDWPGLRASMAAAIARSATPHRDDRLFPGDIEQFVTGGLTMAHGAAGVLYALAVTGAPRLDEHDDWLRSRAVRPAPGVRIGFYDGLHGIAHALDVLGHRADARKVLDICISELAGKSDHLSLDLYGGLAGIGLNLLHFAGEDPPLADEALRMGAAVAARLGDEDSVATVSGWGDPYAGLMRGSAGPALLFVHLYEHTGDGAWLDLAATALRQDLRRCVRGADGTLDVNEDWRTMPYLAEGSVGIGLVLARFLRHRHDDGFAEATGAITLAATSPFYVEPGLFSGRAGMIVHLAGVGAPKSRVRDQVARLGWHAMSCEGDLAFPGEQLLRLSMDLATGTAGVLLAVGAALHREPVHLPFLGSTPVGPAPVPEPAHDTQHRR